MKRKEQEEGKRNLPLTHPYHFLMLTFVSIRFHRSASMVKKNLSGVVGRGGLLGVAVAVGAVTYYLYFIHKRKKSSNDFDAKILIRKLEERVQVGALCSSLFRETTDCTIINHNIVSTLKKYYCIQHLVGMVPCLWTSCVLCVSTQGHARSYEFVHGYGFLM